MHLKFLYPRFYKSRQIYIIKIHIKQMHMTWSVGEFTISVVLAIPKKTKNKKRSKIHDLLISPFCIRCTMSATWGPWMIWMYFSVSKSSFKVISLCIFMPRFMPSRLVKITRLHSFIDGRPAQRSCHSVVFFRRWSATSLWRHCTLPTR